MLKKILILITAMSVALLVACRAQAPVRIESSDMHNLTSGKMALCIRKAASRRNWVTKDIKPGLIQATYTKGEHVAVVDIKYNARGYEIAKNDKTNLDKDDGMVDNKFNQWVRNLDKDIRKEVKRAEFGNK